MEILREAKVLLLEIEYEFHRGKDERQDVFLWLDKKYGESKWRSRRSGPSTKYIGKGFMVVEVEI